MKEEDIVKIRDELQTHNTAMQILLATITLHVSSSGTEMIIEQLVPDMRQLTLLVENMAVELQPLRLSHPHEAAIIRSSEQL